MYANWQGHFWKTFPGKIEHISHFCENTHAIVLFSAVIRAIFGKI
jgi:hypothetical protein